MPRRHECRAGRAATGSDRGYPHFVRDAVDHPGAKARGEVVTDDAVRGGSGLADVDDLERGGPANCVETQLVATDDVDTTN